MIHKLLAVGCTMLLLLDTCHAQSEVPAKYQPKLNLHPKYYMTVDIAVTPNATNKIYMKWNAIYAVQNKNCVIHINPLEGVTILVSKTKTKILTFNKDAKISFKIPLDRFYPGQCGWNISTIEYYIYSKKHKKKILSAGSVMFAKPNKKNKISNNKFIETMSCKFSACNLLKQSTLFNSNNRSYESNYYYDLTIK